MVSMDFRKFYDKTATSYDKRHDSPASLMLRKKENGLIKKYATGRVLDIGCGTGYHMGHGENIKNIIGVDISDYMLKIARKRGFNVKKARAEDLPFQDNSFDTIFCFFAVLNMCNSSQAVKEMARVLKPGGCALLSLSSIHDKQQFKISKQIVQLKKLFTKAGLASLFEKNGLSLEHFDSMFRSGRRPRWGDFAPIPLKERISLWLDRFRSQENGVIYMVVFRKR